MAELGLCTSVLGEADVFLDAHQDVSCRLVSSARTSPHHVLMPAFVTLSGRSVRLEPLSLAAIDDLVVAAGEDRSTYAFTRVPQGRDEMVSYVEAALAEQAKGHTMPFAIRWLHTD